MLENEKKPETKKPNGIQDVIESAENACRSSASGPKMLAEILGVLGKSGIYDKALVDEFASILQEVSEFNEAMAKKLRALAIKAAK